MTRGALHLNIVTTSLHTCTRTEAIYRCALTAVDGCRHVPPLATLVIVSEHAAQRLGDKHRPRAAPSEIERVGAEL